MNRAIIFFLPLLFISSLYSQNNPIDVYNSAPFYNENGVQLNDGDILQLIYAGADNVINPPVTNSSSGNNGQPTGDDVVLSLHHIGENVPPNSGTFYFTATAYPNHTIGYPAAGDYIYIRVFNALNLPSATHYGDGQLHLVTNFLGDLYDVQIPGGQTGNPLPIEQDEKDIEIPTGYKLWQNYPNPFNPSTAFKIEIPLCRNNEKTQVVIYDLSGRAVKTLLDGNVLAGTYELHWNGKDHCGDSMASGIYVLVMKNKHFYDYKKMILLR